MDLPKYKKSKESINVLISGAGSPLGQSIYKALRLSKIQFQIFLTDIRPLAAGFYFHKDSTNLILPPVKNSTYQTSLIEIVKKYNIHCIFPVIDIEHHYFQQSSPIWKQYNVNIITNMMESHNLASDKYKSFVYLKKIGITVPDTIRADNKKSRDKFLEKYSFPIIYKPRFGVSSEKIFIVSNSHMLNGLLNAFHPKDFILQEYLPNASEEYTVGVYISVDGTWKRTFVIKRELKFGLSYTGSVVHNKNIDLYALSVCEALKLRYASNVQLRMVQNRPYVFEINPRLSSTTSVRAFFGYNEPEMILTEIFGDINDYKQNTHKGSFMRYWDEIYSDNTI